MSAGTPPGLRRLLSAHDRPTQMDPRDGRRADDGGLLQFPGRCATGIGPGLVQPIAQRIDRTPERHANLALLP
ncbi:hypothetical protein GCM10010094_05330 [Streptomyces flaveus]|uniref:Uncharacterized protein n=1 Tax=Streptomyces flaveus TaxID=66370 RepID=A0A917QFB1_9ACTN|nr:hypothetical protein GCM10010094_05330 [Streptomyces flaveus]